MPKQKPLYDDDDAKMYDNNTSSNTKNMKSFLFVVLIIIIIYVIYSTLDKKGYLTFNQNTVINDDGCSDGICERDGTKVEALIDDIMQIQDSC